MPDLAVILPAAGSSSRFGKDKLGEMLHGRTVLEWSLRAFVDRSDVSEVILVGRDSSPIQHPKIRLVPGGEHRAGSVWNGVRAVSPDIEWVAIHDAARPLISQGLISKTIELAKQHGAAAPALAVHLTIKRVDSALPAKVEQTVPRQSLYALQTPQVMRRTTLLEALESCPIPLSQVTDDLQLLELIHQPTWLLEGEQRNIKITTPVDLKLAELLLADRI